MFSKIQVEGFRVFWREAKIQVEGFRVFWREGKFQVEGFHVLYNKPIGGCAQSGVRSW